MERVLSTFEKIIQTVGMFPMPFLSIDAISIE